MYAWSGGLFSVAVFGLIAFICYFPVILNLLYARCLKKKYYKQLKLLPKLYDSSRIVVTRPLGLGPEPEQNKVITFEEAHKNNQEIALKSILTLL